MDINLLLFQDFTALDAFGPVEVLCGVPEYTLRYISMEGGVITNGQGIRILTEPLNEADKTAIWVLPGGWGTRPLTSNGAFLEALKEIAETCTAFLSVCTGAALLAKAGVLDGKKATSNKKSFDWVVENGPKVLWERDARWVKEGKIYTAAGVSAGIDMALGFLEDTFGTQTAESTARRMEYVWNRDCAEGFVHTKHDTEL